MCYRCEMGKKVSSPEEGDGPARGCLAGVGGGPFADEGEAVTLVKDDQPAGLNLETGQVSVQLAQALREGVAATLPPDLEFDTEPGAAVVQIEVHPV